MASAENKTTKPAWSIPPAGWLAAAALACITTALGLYALALNHLFYATHGPFYDSLAYSLTLARVYAHVREQGLAAGLASVFGMTSTVVLPWIEACFFALAVPLSRDLFVWIQLPWFLILGLAGYRYFHGRIGHAALPALALCLPPMAIRAVFYFDGGLSDFRMDLLQYLLLTASFLIYLSIRQRSAPAGLAAWALLGATAGLACLVRATTPVYLLLGFGPPFVIDMLGERRRGALLARYGMAVLVLVLVAGWFYAVNFRSLHYYYFVWNTAANEKLPLSRSFAHLEILLGQNIGWPLIAFLGLSIGLGAIHRRAAGLPLRRDLNWRALWFGLAPLAFLILWGAGLNPFASILAAGGLLIFGEAPWIGSGTPRPRWMQAALVLAATAASLATASTGISSHGGAPEWVPRAAAIDDLMRQLTADIARRPPGIYVVSYVHAGSIDSDVVKSQLVFAMHLPYDANGSIRLGPSLIQTRSGPGKAVTRVQWEALPGGDDAAKIAAEVSAILQQGDYVLLPTADSRLFVSSYVNAYAPEFRRRLLASGRLTLLAPPIAVSPTESVAWYRIARNG
jgi:hypothetical protein